MSYTNADPYIRVKALFQKIEQQVCDMPAPPARRQIERNHIVQLAARAELVRQFLEQFTNLAEGDYELHQLLA